MCKEWKLLCQGKKCVCVCGGGGGGEVPNGQVKLL